MAKVNKVNKAQKDDPNFGIKKGDTYYWWKFRFGPVRKSKTYPKRSQLTQSEYLVAVRSLRENFSIPEGSGVDDARQAIDEVLSELDSLYDELESKFYNLPDSLQGAPVGQLIEERMGRVEEAKSNIESIDDPDDRPEELDNFDEDKSRRSAELTYSDWSEDEIEEFVNGERIAYEDEINDRQAEIERWDDELIEWLEQTINTINEELEVLDE